jgi:hypothetical protein
MPTDITFTNDDYTVGWICALPNTELAASQAMLDEEHPDLLQAENDTNTLSQNLRLVCRGAEGGLARANQKNRRFFGKRV